MAHAFDALELEEILRQHAAMPGALLPILHAIQEAFGFIPPESVASIAACLSLSRAEVHGVITYYHHFRQSPVAGTLIQMCRAEACQARGANALIAHAEQTLGCALHESSVDGQVTLEPVYCLDHCATGPNIQVGDKLYGRVSPVRFTQLLMRRSGEKGVAV
jgi:formate dehydrogenase subunit gamma